MRSPGSPSSKGEQPIRLPVLLIVASTALLASLDLPLDGPVPAPRPDIGNQAGEETDQSKKPGIKPDAGAEPADDRPQKQQEADVAPPVEKEDAKLFATCADELKSMGAEFSEAERIDEGNGCGIDRPIEVKSLGNGVALSPPGTLRCQAAVNLARWTRDVVTPMLKKSQPEEMLAEVNQASAYVCRKRNNAVSGKISEHARGTAIDIAGFTFKSGRTFTIEPREEEPTLDGAFQRAIASAACLYFSTVLDPGSDKAHETHLHLDTLKRRGGYRYCW